MTHAASGRDAALSAGDRRRNLAAVIACISSYGVTMGLTFPLLSLILEQRGVEATWIGLNAAMPALGTLCTAPFVPRILALGGVRRFLWACIGLEVLLFLSLPVFDNLPAWFALRFLIGATGTSLFVASETWINELAEESNRGRIMGIYSAVLSATSALGPALLLVTGIDGWPPFLVGAAFIAIAGLPLAWANAEPGITLDGSSFSTLGFLREAPTLTFGVLLVTVLFVAGNSLLPVYGVDNGVALENAPLLLTMMAAGGIVLQWPIGWLCDHLPRRRVLIICSAGGALGAGLMPLAVGTGAWMWALIFLWGGLYMGVYTVAMTMAGERYRGGRLANAMAAFGVLWGAGSLIGPSLGGGAMDLAGSHALPAMLSVACGAYLLLVVVRGRRDPAS